MDRLITTKRLRREFDSMEIILRTELSKDVKPFASFLKTSHTTSPCPSPRNRQKAEILKLEKKKQLRATVVAHLAESICFTTELKPLHCALAKQIEEELFKLFNGVNKQYKTKYRSLVFHIKYNHVLRQKIVDGALPCGDLCLMSPKDMSRDAQQTDRYSLFTGLDQRPRASEKQLSPIQPKISTSS
eukprot:TRINITY_DN12809_c0_g1_i1.p1 TRINITY_DN12809_c0_g1~~TRINITY_DN12809_c0_g1_i1.p1  ORF type:complete len:187 (+),score=12.34 TRINITY_DN12809_c0_g1_i1:114-674(+)